MKVTSPAAETKLPCTTLLTAYWAVRSMRIFAAELKPIFGGAANMIIAGIGQRASSLSQYRYDKETANPRRRLGAGMSSQRAIVLMLAAQVDCGSGPCSHAATTIAHQNDRQALQQ